jgi:hypothetical protein
MHRGVEVQEQFRIERHFKRLESVDFQSDLEDPLISCGQKASPQGIRLISFGASIHPGFIESHLVDMGHSVERGDS